jgi:acyl-CoA thioesterase YciA
MRLISTKICKTSDIGINNNLFGGIMLSWLDEAGGILAAEQACSKNVVTLKMDQVLFKKPVRVNDHIRIYGKVIRVGNTSLSLLLEARRIDFQLIEEDIVCSTQMTFIKVDENSKPIPLDEKIKEKISLSISK